jgi:hypothetical protein
MKNHLLPFACSCILFTSILSTSYGQAKVSWGEEFKLSKGSTDLTVIKAESTGIYLEELHEVRSIGFFGSSSRTSSNLVKLDANMNELYRKDFDKDLKGKDLETISFIKDKLYLFASGVDKSAKTLNLYAAELDKSSGNVKGDWKQVYTWDVAEKGTNIKFKVTPNSDSTKIILTSTNTGKSQNHYDIQLFDAALRPTGKPFSISNEFDPGTFQVEDFLYTSAGNVILVGRIYEYEEGKKKKEKNLLFKNYNIRVYDNQGKMTKELVTDIDGKFLVNGKLIQLKNQIVLAAFYSNEKRKKEINGMLVERIDALTGNVVTTTKKELNNAAITQVDDDDEGSKDRKKSDDDEGLSSNLVFRNFFLTPDNGLVILAEKYRMHIEQSTSTMGGAGGSQTTSSEVREIYESQDMYMAKISATGNVDWLNDLPKSQYEEHLIGSSMYSGMPLVMMTGYFTSNSNRPFFSGFGCLTNHNILNIFFNDDERNAGVLAPGSRVKRVTRFSKTDCYQLQLDMVTGKYTRKILFSNNDTPPAMPRLGMVFNGSLYITGKDDGHWGHKPKIAVGKISI